MQFLEYHTLLDMEITILILKEKKNLPDMQKKKKKVGKAWC